MSYLSHMGNAFFGMYQRTYSSIWDSKLNQLLDTHSQNIDVKVGPYTITLGEWDIWINNKWYSYGHAWSVEGCLVPKPLQHRPSIYTMHRLDKLVQKIKQGGLLEETK